MNSIVVCNNPALPSTNISPDETWGRQTETMNVVCVQEWFMVVFAFRVLFTYSDDDKLVSWRTRIKILCFVGEFRLLAPYI